MKMRTYRLLLIAVVACCAMAFVSCGDDDPSGGDDGKITRVQDGDGKAFLEGGKLVDANLKYTRELRDSAFSHYDWTFEYAICYDSKRISQKIDVSDNQSYTRWPININADNTMVLSLMSMYEYRYEISGRKLIATLIEYEWQSYIDSPHTFKVVAIDLYSKKKTGRLIVDVKCVSAIKGFSLASTYERVVLSGKKVK